jgi:hypothetical protein
LPPSGLTVEEISSCSGFLSQSVTALWRALKGPIQVRFLLTLPLRVLPLVFDAALAKIAAWPNCSICVVAYKPRFDR